MAERYTIQEVGKEFGLTARALRHYEELGLLAPARRGTVRLYSENDRKRLRLVLRGRRLGFSLEEIGEMLTLHYARPGEVRDPAYSQARIASHRAKLGELKDDVSMALDWLHYLEGRLAQQMPKRA
ncbi:MAG: MerR family transcriptional regulator [Alphaproteobacteria bacterium]